jgi:hypothetical protein
LIAGFVITSNDNTRPTADCTFPFGVGVACVVEVVCEPVSFAAVGAGVCVAELAAVGADEVVVLVVWVVSEFWTVGWVSAVAGEDWVVWTDVLEVVVVCVVGATAVTLVGFTGLIGLTGLLTLVGFVTDFTQLLDVVAQGCTTGLPYGSGHIKERVWIMLPV